ncbi:Solute carrier family 2, facilitated glucose transporter member 3 isoform 3 [Schistosoma japonicum]|uniref:Solute carrier family 2, facilitated glucose transporter member 3 isoform 3 n=2 Tax=Schistosoma japonicum TaxID=6182 RepID=A0A4Z2CTN4_SCHJA|nr:Glucose transporter type 1 [Schistosoma japonicum]KAH8859735.1 Glucose transporter type 1 [Schistosoma japonicum]TNN07644.1 Solute carrier family 2, facilitated glucose transporter member 3 isoform 3 [Schistosoma japonicum]TNN07646.1 Solute carrier family 2, facilitated glucose transporter member 3 isoform 3 [Schistosoma japonicum]
MNLLKFSIPYVVITSGCSFPFGYQTGVINAPADLIKSFISATLGSRSVSCDEHCINLIWSLCVTFFLLGGFFGGLTGGILANKLGRKNSLFLLSIPTILGSLLMMFSKMAQSFEMIIAGRFIIGIACGAHTVIGPMYLSEIAPVSFRGAAGTLNQFVIVIGILLSQILGLPQVMGTAELWPYLLALCIIPSVIHIILLFTCPESPTYLYIVKGDRRRSENALLYFRGHDCDIHSELELLKNETEHSSRRKVNVCDLLRIPHLRWALIVAVVPHIGQQLSGINGILYYFVSLFISNGLTKEIASYANLGTGGTILIGTFVSLFIIDRQGRRPLLMFGILVCLLSLLLFTLTLIIKQVTGINEFTILSIVLTYTFLFGFSMSLGPIPWFLVSELFTQENRDTAVSIAAAINWLCNAIVALIFPQLTIYIGIYAFIPFVCVLLAVLIFIQLYLPETKGKTPAAVEAHFMHLYGFHETEVHENPIFTDI